ncbi:23S rRNA pseudouridine 1911/1915/1917 synthase [Entomoplasma ellychniae]|uniref:Pseudouridine synthase n=1 Tax=Entomoplasma ellychniae TaxID=2114 RepID=A0A8E2U9U3_9MOLU|nr:RluA family pseudouridine synthase [Entomoplasma ellychniae]PPE04499.1 23S rRNA pseudouridine 1911/1915/1917 synthase [Entomoplasma ellychniae]
MTKILINEVKNRLDKFLVEQLNKDQEYSRSYIQKLIKDGNILVNGEMQTKSNTNLQVSDKVEINFPEIKKSELKGEKIDLNIVYEDEHLLVINKANNMVVHPGAGNPDGTLVNALLGREEINLSNIGGVERPGIVHRLDKQTTGLVIVAKNDKTHQELSNQLKDHKIYKEYIALVWGNIEEEKGVIDAPIGRHQNDRKKMMVTNKNSKYAKTNFEVLERFENTTLVKCWIETGRTHQIRVHFNFIKFPIVNDPIYGRLSDKTDEFGQMLHAYKLQFIHPIKKEMVKLKTELPKEFLDRIKKEGGTKHEW